MVRQQSRNSRDSDGKGGKRMRFGLLLSAVHDDRALAGLQVREHLELTEIAVGYGFDLVMVGQHFLPERLRYYQPVPYLAWLGTAFPTIRVGTGIMLLPLMRPVEAAEQIATLDVVTAGRVVFGIGLGYADRDFQVLGIPKAERVQRLVEGLDLIRSLWRGDRTEHHGVFGDFLIERPVVRPLQDPHPPVWLAAQAPAAVRRCATIADAWYPPPFLTHDELRRLAVLHTAERAAAGRPPATEMPVRREVFIAPTVDQARAGAAPYAVARTRTYLDWGLRQKLNGNTAMNAEDAASISQRFLLGPPELIAAELLKLRSDIGMTDFVYRSQWPGMPFSQTKDQLRRFGEEVIPRVLAAVPVP
jgi:alkanesulfonate monooxygenase SsuD/methylene tetrahydromethanopterin reductase-like flavin-dependent oxidoreductase (luciferase family)